MSSDPSPARRQLPRAYYRPDMAIASGLLIAVVFTALAHGAVEAWSVAIFQSLVLALIIIWAFKILYYGRLEISIPPAALPLGALVALGLVQSIAVYEGDGRRLSLSRDVEATRTAVTTVFYLLASFIIAANFFTSRKRLRILTIFLLIYGLAMALFALVQYSSWDGRFYWLRPNTQTASPFGPFVSHNHFAGYMEMLIPMPLALAAMGAVRGESKVFYGFAAVLMGVATVASLSRGGMIGMSASLAFVFVAILRRAIRQRGLAGASAGFQPSLAFLLVIVATTAGGILWIGPETIVNRLTAGSLTGAEPGTESFFSSRGWIWRDGLAMFQANPLTGVGMGAFQTAYPTYSRSDGTLSVAHAHNDYLQVLTDCGIIGAVLAVWFIISLFQAVARGMRSREPFLSGLALGSGAGIFAMLVHSVFDFNLQLPSNALMFLLLSAMTWQVSLIVGEQDSKAHGQRPLETRAAGLATGVGQ